MEGRAEENVFALYAEDARVLLANGHTVTVEDIAPRRLCCGRHREASAVTKSRIPRRKVTLWLFARSSVSDTPRYLHATTRGPATDRDATAS